MIEEITKLTDYIDFANTIFDDINYRDPHIFSKDEIKSLFTSSENGTEYIRLRTFENNVTTGIFVLIYCPEDNYLESIYNFSNNKASYQELFEYIKKYKGCNIDFVFNPKSQILLDLLKEKNAEIDKEQQRLALQKSASAQINAKVIEYNELYKEQYFDLHVKENIYWTADKVLQANDRFKVVLALDGDKVVGYLDITYSYDENEIYDVFVLPEYRNKGYCTSMVLYTINNLNIKNQMLLVDIDNIAALTVYEKCGFVKTQGNNITASLEI